MPSRRCLASAGAAALVLLSLPAGAQTSFRCKGDLVSVGDSQASALLKCGEPVVKGSFCKAPVPQTAEPTPRSGTVVVPSACETVDEWTYNPGYGQLMTTLRFESGQLVAIRYGDRVR